MDAVVASLFMDLYREDRVEGRSPEPWLRRSVVELEENKVRLSLIRGVGGAVPVATLDSVHSTCIEAQAWA